MMSGMNSKPLPTVRFAISFAGLLLAGCYWPASRPVITNQTGPQLTFRRSIIATSIEDRPIERLVLGRGPDTTFVLAAIHGDEPAGATLVRKLADHIRQNPLLMQQRKLVLLPVANPDGIAHNDRYNARGIDLNRNFPTPNRTADANHGPKPLSEPEAAVIDLLIRQYAPDRIISIHQLTDTGPEALANLVPDGCIDYDGPAEKLAQRLAQYCDLPIEKLGSRPGSLGSYAGLTLNIPTITFELPLSEPSLSPQSLWQRYGKALLAAIGAGEAEMQNEAGAI